MPTEPEMEELPGRTSSSFLPLTRNDRWFSLAMLAFAVIVAKHTNVIGFFTMIVAWSLLLLKGESCRYYMTVPLWFKGLKHNVWAPGDATLRNRAERKRVRRKSEDDKTVIPFVVTSVPSDLGGGTIGIMHRKQQHTDSFVVTGGGSKIAALSLLGQQAFYDHLVEMIRKLVSSNRGYSVGVSFVFRRDPHDAFAFASDQAEYLHPDAMYPEALTIPEDEWTDEQYRWFVIGNNQRELREEVIPQFTQEVWMAMVVTIKRTGVLARAKGSINSKYVGRLPINRMAKTVITGLNSAGAQGVKVLELSELHRFVRGSWDTQTIDQFYALLDNDPEAASRDGFREHWPSKQMEASNGLSITDGTHTTVLRVTNTRKEVLPSFFREFIGSMVEVPHFSFALVGEAVQAKLELAGLERLTSIVDAVGIRLGLTKTLSGQAREERWNKRKRDVFESEFSQSFSLLIALNGGSEDELNEHIETTQTLATTKSMETSRVFMPALQYPAKWSATTGIPML
jgi:hypothetical protein